MNSKAFPNPQTGPPLGIVCFIHALGSLVSFQMHRSTICSGENPVSGCQTWTSRILHFGFNLFGPTTCHSVHSESGIYYLRRETLVSSREIMIKQQRSPSPPSNQRRQQNDEIHFFPLTWNRHRTRKAKTAAIIE